MVATEAAHIEEINQIIWENTQEHSPPFRPRHKKMKKLDFFDSLLNSMETSAYFSRSKKYFMKNKFSKSTHYNRFKTSYIDKLKIYQRSKSAEHKKYDQDEDEEESEGNLYDLIIKIYYRLISSNKVSYIYIPHLISVSLSFTNYDPLLRNYEKLQS